VNRYWEQFSIIFLWLNSIRSGGQLERKGDCHPKAAGCVKY
jgi:hypothetical protein